MKKLLLLVPALSLGLFACASGPTPIPAADSAAAKLYAEKCGVCHAVPHPKRNTSDDWQHLLALMEQRMEERGMDKLSDQERTTLMEYLDANAR